MGGELLQRNPADLWQEEAVAQAQRAMAELGAKLARRRSAARRALGALQAELAAADRAGDRAADRAEAGGGVESIQLGARRRWWRRPWRRAKP